MKNDNKKLTLLLLATAAFYSNTVSAQENPANKYDHGLRLGINLAEAMLPDP
jgi:hypothetical protein